MAENTDKNVLNRREFMNRGLRVSIGVGLGLVGVQLFRKSSVDNYVWQLDMEKCIQCGRCATSCVKMPSAVKCIHVYDMCGYCDLCGGYFRPKTKILTTAAENQLCPTSAIERRFIEEPFFEYHINEDLCIGCGKCVAGCSSFGNGSLQLQVNPSLCDNCNQCSVARNCPSEAFKRIPNTAPYLLNGYDNNAKLIK